MRNSSLGGSNINVIKFTKLPAFKYWGEKNRAHVGQTAINLEIASRLSTLLGAKY